MKTFFLIIALCASVAVATPDEEFNRKIAKCLQEAEWTVEDYKSECSTPYPEDTPKMATLMDVLACIYQEAGILNQNRSGMYYLKPAMAKTLIPKEDDGEKWTKIFKACTRIVTQDGDMAKPNIIALRLNNCLYWKDAKIAEQTCISLMAGVVLDDRKT